MILQALQEYYDRKAKVPKSSVAQLGWEIKEIPYIVALDAEGNPQEILCTIEGTGKKKTVGKFCVPQGVKRASNILANLLWDNPEYVFGLSIKKKDDPKSVKKQASFREKIEELGTTDDPGIVALKKFLAFSLDEKVTKLDALNNENWETLKKDPSANVTFKLLGESGIIAESPGFNELYERSKATSTGEIIRCLVSGEQDVLERLHPSIRGVRGGNPTGTSIVSFNLDPFRSYGKGQGANAPIGKKAAFAYTTALNMLLAKGSQNCMFIGDASIVFWSEKKCNLENNFIPIFAGPPKDDPDQNVGKVKELYNSVSTGAEVESDAKNRFYILGLSPNSARLAIRFWINSTVKDVSTNIERYFQETEITHRDMFPEHLPVIRLLKSIAVQGKSENIPPNLEGDLMRAILVDGLAYPQTLLSATVQRIRAERLPANYEASYARAALLKAFFNRKKYLAGKSPKRPSKEDLDKKTNNQEINYQEFEAFKMNPKDNEKHTEPGFLLGRLFATLEKIQSEANPGINATIRDRFYGAASGTPVVVFPNLLRLKNHHLSKLDNEGRKVNFERLLCDIMSKIDCFPANLSLEQQGLFALGYYYQMQDFYTKKSDKEEVKQEVENAE